MTTDKTSGLIFDEMSDEIIKTTERIAMTSGADKVNVRCILKELGITNRVFYNRFHNIDEVLQIVYKNTVLAIRSSVSEKFDPDGDFFEQIIDIVANTLIMSYELRMRLNLYVFENDSVLQDNYEWWKAEIKRLIKLGKASGYVRDVDTDAMSYAIWCFIRGYIADAIGRRLPLETAERDFRYSFGILIDGMKK